MFKNIIKMAGRVCLLAISCYKTIFYYTLKIVVDLNFSPALNVHWGKFG